MARGRDGGGTARGTSRLQRPSVSGGIGQWQCGDGLQVLPVLPLRRAVASRMRRTPRLPEPQPCSSEATLSGRAQQGTALFRGFIFWPQVQVASLLCSPGSPSSPSALQDAPRVPSQALFQVVPVASEHLKAAKESRPLPSDISLQRSRALPDGLLEAAQAQEAAQRGRVVAKACKRRPAPALPPVPSLPLPDGDLIESFSDNPPHNALQGPGPKNGQESCNEVPEPSPHRELEGKQSGSDALPSKAPSELEAGLHTIRSPGLKEVKDLNLPASSTQQHRAKRANRHRSDLVLYSVAPFCFVRMGLLREESLQPFLCQVMPMSFVPFSLVVPSMAELGAKSELSGDGCGMPSIIVEPASA